MPDNREATLTLTPVCLPAESFLHDQDDVAYFLVTNIALKLLANLEYAKLHDAIHIL
jgi:hypothetical protein